MADKAEKTQAYKDEWKRHNCNRCSFAPFSLKRLGKCEITTEEGTMSYMYGHMNCPHQHELHKAHKEKELNKQNNN